MINYHTAAPGKRGRNWRARQAIAAAIACAVFAAGRISAGLYRVRLLPPAAVPKAAASTVAAPTMAKAKLDALNAHFAAVVGVWNAYVIAHDGDLPPDPYALLLDSGKVDGMSELRWYEFNLEMPPRVNQDLKQNVKCQVFAYDGRWGNYWFCYADGTWDRLIGLPSKAPGPWAAPTILSLPTLMQAGYPASDWHRLADRAAWMARNRCRLAWDPARRIYVVRPIPATRYIQEPRE